MAVLSAQACVLAVPKLHVHYRGREQAAHLRKMGYRELPPSEQQQQRQGKPQQADQNGAAAGAPQFESTDAFSGRLQGYTLFLGALLQSARLPDGLPRAWQWLARSAFPSKCATSSGAHPSVLLRITAASSMCASCIAVHLCIRCRTCLAANPCFHQVGMQMLMMRRLLNHLPATRLSATALEAFLKAAGFRLAAAYGRQFQKLLALVEGAYLGDLERQGDPDARAVHSRLRTYIRLRQFATEPEGRRMPVSDISAREHA